MKRSGKHMPKKERFMSEMNHVLNSNGALLLIMATWRHQKIKSQSLNGKLIIDHLNRLSNNYCLPKWVSVETLANQLHLKEIQTDDWT
ncbi:unnamed protein product [Didymodactylos carnosus]|uniref:Uncharacterized protein n=1 Tax=Didymodactylos carnosus TaxID=1234261 RepID=A0A816F8A3_9BILA|nr:unnamed protein product [Didymodactylos carnosus]CAF1659082.1 unnamed protein product [Didymodactylos carnosus]CAF4492121.1 unnamed protein product [Didymodactylos carnosus]CAF4602708.1 unnamed protein product [Didymodactylos carnosus]